MPFSPDVARAVAANVSSDTGSEAGLVESFVTVCAFLNDNEDRLSWRGKTRPSVSSQQDLQRLADKYFGAYRASDFPAVPKTVPDHVVSVILNTVHGYSDAECEHIKLEHQHSMCAENCVGALLERYVDSALRSHGWSWCCGSFVKAIDFLAKNDEGLWLPVQIKNRDNTENSSSSSVRYGTDIVKWFRSFSRTGKTNWGALPHDMGDYGLSEEGFIQFVEAYLEAEIATRE